MKNLGILGAALIIACTAIPPVSHATDLTTVRLVSGLSRPDFVTAPPGDTDRIFTFYGIDRIHYESWF